MKKVYTYVFFLILVVLVGIYLYFSLNEVTTIEVKLYPKNISIYPFEQVNITVYVNSSKPIKDLIVTLENENSSAASILFPNIKNFANTSLLLSLNKSTEIRAIPDSVYLYNVKRVGDSARIIILQPNMSFFQLPEYKKLEVMNFNSKGMRAISYFTSFPLSIFWSYINFTHIENAITNQNKSFTNIYIQATLSPKQIADFFAFVYKKNYSKIDNLYFFDLSNSTICVLPKEGFTRIIVAERENCKNFVNIPSTTKLKSNLNLSKLNITSPYIGEILNSEGMRAKGFSYQYGYYFIVRYPKLVNCSYPFKFENKSFCINSILQTANGYQFKVINITYENLGFYFLNFNSSIENQIQQFAFSKLSEINGTTP